MRYLERDLPPSVSHRLQDLTFVRDLEDLEAKLAIASAWGATVLQELGST